MSLEPDKIYLHDPHGVFEEDGHSGMEIVMWSKDRIDENDYEYIRSQNLAKPDAYSLLADVRAKLDEALHLLSKEDLWDDEGIIFKAHQIIFNLKREHFS